MCLTPKVSGVLGQMLGWLHSALGLPAAPPLGPLCGSREKMGWKPSPVLKLPIRAR